MHLRPLGQLSTSIFQSVFPTNKNSFKKLLGRKTGKKTKNYSIFKFENPNKIKVFLRTKLPNSLKFSSHKCALESSELDFSVQYKTLLVSPALFFF